MALELSGRHNVHCINDEQSPVKVSAVEIAEQIAKRIAKTSKVNQLVEIG